MERLLANTYDATVADALVDKPISQRKFDPDPPNWFGGRYFAESQDTELKGAR
jgi:hypothetical protein